MQNQTGFSRLLHTEEPADLGPRRRQGVQSQKDLETELDALLQNSQISPDREQAIRALVLLWHDHLDAAHDIAQKLDTPDGAFVHGIVHRREPDFGNAAYWFRRVGPHPSFVRISQGVEALVKPEAASGAWSARLIPGGQWNPFEFISACEEAGRAKTGEANLLRNIQHVEFKELLGWLGERTGD